MTNNELSNYLQQVRVALGDHPETDDIVQELQAHIWDYANNISRKSGCSVDDAFSMAIQSMEDPQTLASSFNLERTQSSSSWMEPQSSLPEKKISDKEFMFMGIIAFFAATVILSIISWVGRFTDTDLGIVNFIFGLIQFVILITLVLGFFYYRNEQEFQEQLLKLKQKFEKISELDEKDPKNRAKIKAAELHIEGLLEVVFGIAGLVLILYTSYIWEWILYTDLWYSIGIISVVSISVVEILRGIMKLFVGQIRASRLVNGAVNLLNVLVSTLLIVFYPFDLVPWLESFSHPTAVAIGDWILQATSQPDYSLKVFLGLVAILYFLNAMYNLAKFSMWTPSDQYSLTIKTEGSS